MSEEYVWKEATGKLAIRDFKPNYNMTFHRDGKQIGVLDFNGPEMVFSGDMDESAKVFFDYVATVFKARLDQERADERNRTWTQEHWTEYERSIVEAEREACAKVCEEEANRAKWNWDNDISGNQQFWNGGEQLAYSCAAAIRARSKNEDRN